MKTKKISIILLLWGIMTSMFSFAQSINTLAETENNDWKPIKLENGNIISGISIYSKSVECDSKKVKSLKIVNNNTFPIKVSYQLSESQPVVNVMVPASVSVEGSCEVKEGNLHKLILVLPETNSQEEKQKRNEFIRGHLFANKIE